MVLVIGVSGFDPRLRAGGDGVPVRAFLLTFCVSIHASAREATCCIGRNPSATGFPFRSTPPRGRRREADIERRQHGEFRSTPPRGRRRRALPSSRPWRWSFDPRLRAGGDRLAFERLVFTGAVSIHASAREATLARDQGHQAEVYGFDPRLRAGGDPGSVADWEGGRNSPLRANRARRAAIEGRRKAA